MKAMSANITGGVQVESYLKCADNSGADEIQIIAVKGYKGVKSRRAPAGVGDVIFCTVKKGDPKIRHEVVQAVIIRQRKEYKRANGLKLHLRTMLLFSE